MSDLPIRVNLAGLWVIAGCLWLALGQPLPAVAVLLPILSLIFWAKGCDQ